MAIECPCPGCGVVLGVPEEHAGKQARCPECSVLFVVPKETVVIAAPANAGADAVHPVAVEGAAETDERLDSGEIVASETAGQLAGSTLAGAAGVAVADVAVAEEPAPLPDLRKWWLKTPEGAVYGPVSKDQLDVWCEEGRVADDCQLKHEEEHAWRNADQEYSALHQEVADSRPFQMSETPVVNAPARLVIVLPHRGVIITALGIASWITVFCPIFGVLAWNMGNRDLELMYAGQMDATGIRITHIGRMLGLIHVLTFVMLLIAGLGFAVIFLVTR